MSNKWRPYLVKSLLILGTGLMTSSFCNLRFDADDDDFFEIDDDEFIFRFKPVAGETEEVELFHRS